MTQGQIFKRSLTGLNSEFSFSKTSCLTKAEEISLSYYLPIAGGRIIGFIPFPRVLVLCEMQSASSRIWNRVAVSISYDDNHYTTSTLLLPLLPSPLWPGVVVCLRDSSMIWWPLFQLISYCYRGISCNSRIDALRMLNWGNRIRQLLIWREMRHPPQRVSRV